MPYYNARQSAAGGGGGGAGRSNNLAVGGGAGGIRVLGYTTSLSGGSLIENAQNGGTGTISSQGGGGYRGQDLDYGDTHAVGGTGGSGGFYGSAGAAGAGPEYANATPRTAGGGAGGAGGLAVNGNSNITWGATGTRYGGIIG